MTDIETDASHHSDETPQANDLAKRRSRSRAATLLILAVLIVAAGAALVIANVGRPEDPTVVPDEWQAADLEAAETVDIGDGEYTAVVVIAAGEETCWNGYIGDHALEGCGGKTFTAQDVEATIGANVSSTESTKNFIGLAIWDEDAKRLVESGKTRKKFGTVALTASIADQ